MAKGIITAVDSVNDTADVTVEGYQDGSDVPLFYHCEPDSEERSNGAIYGAAAAFMENDEVIVMLEVNNPPVRIVGFVDGIKSCSIQVKLFRGDGTPVRGIVPWQAHIDDGLWPIGYNWQTSEWTFSEATEEEVPHDLDEFILTSLYLRDPELKWPVVSFLLDEITGFWTITVLDSNRDGDPDWRSPLGYWIYSSCVDGADTIYPYRFRSWIQNEVGYTDKYQVEDLVRGGKFIDILPYEDSSGWVDDRADGDCGSIMGWSSYFEDAKSEPKTKGVRASFSAPYVVHTYIPLRSDTFYGKCGGDNWWIEGLSVYLGPMSQPDDAWAAGYVKSLGAGLGEYEPNVYLPMVVATEVAEFLDNTGGSVLDWTAFDNRYRNTQITDEKSSAFPGLTIGEGGITETNHEQRWHQGADGPIYTPNVCSVRWAFTPSASCTTLDHLPLFTGNP